MTHNIFPAIVKRQYMLTIALVIICSQLQYTAAFIPSFVHLGSCGNLPTAPHFDPIKYQGWWWDVERVPNEYQQEHNCINQNITWTGESLMILSRGLSKSEVLVRSSATLDSDDGNEAGLMTVSSPGVPLAPYQVIATDYKRYSCVYSCLQYPGVYAELYWILGRQPDLPEEVKEICREMYEKNGIDISSLVEVQHDSNCPYYTSLEQMISQNEKFFSTFTLEQQTTSMPDKLVSIQAWYNSTDDNSNINFDYNDFQDTTLTDFYMNSSVSAGIISISVIGALLILISIILGWKRNGGKLSHDHEQQHIALHDSGDVTS